ncbi:MAG: nicotinamide mononucleotide transporter [Saprospiraceae bacterium]|nr:nicotinamide mononucleotide transporter [Saprospiraceae bacterium]
MLDQIFESIWSFGWVQWLAFLFNILYVILAARENIWCWLFGLLGVIFLFVIYLDARLFSDALLQVFYMIMSIYGWISWSKRNENSREIRFASFPSHVLYIATGLAGTLLLGFIFSHFGAALPYVDAFTSSFAVVTTFLVARKIIENWLYWIVIDMVCVVVYVNRSLPLIAFLFFIYTVLAVYGWVQWRNKYGQELQA